MKIFDVLMLFPEMYSFFFASNTHRLLKRHIYKMQNVFPDTSNRSNHTIRILTARLHTLERFRVASSTQITIVIGPDFRLSYAHDSRSFCGFIVFVVSAALYGPVALYTCGYDEDRPIERQ